MFKRIDESKFVARLISLLSNSLAEQRGLVPLLGVGMVFLGMSTLLVDVFLEIAFIQFIGVFLQGLGIIVALISLLLSEPLGK